MPRLPVDICHVEDFLRLPDFKPAFEFFRGRVVQKVAKDLARSAILGGLMTTLDRFARPRKLGRVYVSLRIVCGGCALVPEVSFFTSARSPTSVGVGRDDDITWAPELAVEFLAPGQPPSEPRGKLRHLIHHGRKLGWLIDPRRERIAVIRPEGISEIVTKGGALNGGDIFPGFSISLEEIFGWPSLN